MQSHIARVVAILLLLSLVVPTPAFAQPEAPVARTLESCVEGVLPSGALSLICVPPAWNGDLVIFGHGYTAFNEPLAFQNLTLPDGAYLPDIVQGLGFAFATTSYRRNGLAILEGVQDVRELVAAFPPQAGRAPVHTYMVGASEGGIVTTLLIERYPELFSGGLAACGPIGSMRKQVDYWTDFRVLFDYFFPNVFPPSPVQIPSSVIDNWANTYEQAVLEAVNGNASAARQLLSTSNAPWDPGDPSSIAGTARNLLWYNVFATNDGRQQLGGNPFGNRVRWYSGSLNDFRLNRTVQRFTADPVALANLAPYETSGTLTRPLVTLHTTRDEIIPFWHELTYLSKLRVRPGGSLTPIPIFRYGHCNFTTNEMLAGFGILVLRATGAQPDGLEQQFSLDQIERDFARARAESR